MFCFFKVSNSSLRIFLGAFLGAAWGLMPPTANANIIDDTYGAGAGGFELGAFVNDGSDYMSLPPGDTTITGWTVGGPGAGVDWVTGPTFGVDTGNYALDLQYFTASSIATVIPTVANAVYEISFGAAANSSYPSNTGIVSAGSLVDQLFAAAFSNDLSTQTFTPFTFLFTATGLITMITFTSNGPNTLYGPVIDSVNVDLVSVPPPSSVPEPSSIALLLLGGGVLCARARTRRHCGMRNA